MTPTAYIPVPISDPPTKNGFYFTLMGERTGNNWFKEGRWLDEILNGIPTEVTHWLRPVDLSKMIQDAFEAGVKSTRENARVAYDRNDYSYVDISDYDITKDREKYIQQLDK